MNFANNSTTGTSFGMQSSFSQPQSSLIAPISSASHFQSLATTQPSISTATLVSTSFSLPISPTVNSSFGAPNTQHVTRNDVTATSSCDPTQSPIHAIINQLDFCQFEELINRCSLRLDKVEKKFMDQAAQVSSWDNMLIDNSNKIRVISNAVEKVKIEQQALEQELEFIDAELDERFKSLQDEFEKSSHIDMEKAQTCGLAENLETQLRQMSEDLNEEYKSGNVNEDPIVQIGLILNVLMNSLQRFEPSASHITAQIDKISKMHDSLKYDNEKTFRSIYND